METTRREFFFGLAQGCYLSLERSTDEKKLTPLLTIDTKGSRA
jgi:hypothetical protein